MKFRIRIISLILILVLFPAMVVPAYANESSSVFVNGLEYLSRIDLGEFTTNSRNYGLAFTEPLPFSYIDMVVSLESGYISSVFNTTLSVELITEMTNGLKYYRIFGNLNTSYLDYLFLSFEGYFPSSYNDLKFHSVNFSSTVYNSTDASFELQISYLSEDYLFYGDGTERVGMYDGGGNSFGIEHFYMIQSFGSDWRKYDKLTAVFYLDVFSVTSVYCTIGSLYVPVEVSEFSYSSSGANNPRVFSVTVDLSSLEKNVEFNPSFYVEGNALSDGYSAFYVIDSNYMLNISDQNSISSWFRFLYNGFSSWFLQLYANISDNISYLNNNISSLFSGLNTNLTSFFNNLGVQIDNQTNSLITHFQYLWDVIVIWGTNIRDSIVTWGSNIVSSVSTWGQNIVSAINPDPDAGEDAKDQGAEKGQAIGNLNDQMNAMAKPDLSGSGDISGIISPGDLSNYTTFLTTVVNAPYISQVVMLSLILSLAGYVLFGKR